MRRRKRFASVAGPRIGNIGGETHLYLAPAGAPAGGDVLISTSFDAPFTAFMYLFDERNGKKVLVGHCGDSVAVLLPFDFLSNRLR
jgi:hypothetical protein